MMQMFPLSADYNFHIILLWADYNVNFLPPLPDHHNTIPPLFTENNVHIHPFLPCLQIAMLTFFHS